MPWFASGRDLEELTKRVGELEDDKKRMELEWEEVYDRFRRLLARISKRQEALEKAEEGPRSADREDPRQLSLTDDERIAKLNAQIRQNRRAGAV